MYLCNPVHVYNISNTICIPFFVHIWYDIYIYIDVCINIHHDLWTMTPRLRELSAAEQDLQRATMLDPQNSAARQKLERLGATAENHGKTMGKPWENHGKTMGKPWDNGDLTKKNSESSWDLELIYDLMGYNDIRFTIWLFKVAVENHHL